MRACNQNSPLKTINTLAILNLTLPRFTSTQHYQVGIIEVEVGRFVSRKDTILLLQPRSVLNEVGGTCKQESSPQQGVAFIAGGNGQRTVFIFHKEAMCCNVQHAWMLKLFDLMFARTFIRKHLCVDLM